MSGSSTPEALPTAAFDYALPRHLIAAQPAARRDASRLLVVHRASGGLEHRVFADLLDLLPAGDALVLNESRVFPARLQGRKPTGARAEILLLHPYAVEAPDVEETEALWVAMVRPGGRLREGAVVGIAPGLEVRIEGVLPGGRRTVRLVTDLPVGEAIERHGRVPLPPYIDREATAEDRERYQTVYARATGSVAAPTAGLHFTPALLEALEAKGVRPVRLVLHVGIGTFRPVEVEDPAEHPMHAERYEVGEDVAEALNAVRAAGGRIWAVGTTVARTLETVAGPDGRIHAGSGWTSLFIRPPWRFLAVDRLITNFHLPRSTLLMLVSAFGGHHAVMRAYAEAIAHEYRFYSYGDAMVLI